MPDRLEDLLRACTVRVTGGPMPGAGFFVAPGRVLTCVHVIGDSADLMVRWERDDQPVVEVPVSGRAAVLEDRGRPIPALDRDYPDIAVLEFEGIGDHPCVRIDPEWPSREDYFLVFGYPQEGGAVQLTPARLTYRGTHGIAPTAYMDLASDTIKPGMSGAAVLNLRSGKVCGVVVASKNPASPDGALAIPWSAIDADLGEVLAANRAFHQRDRRWEAAAASLRERLRFRLPRVVAYFTGRGDLLTRLDAALADGRAGVITQAVTGMGGVGKTQLAAAFVAAHHDEFDIAAWVRADDNGTADLAELAVALGLPVAERTPPERAGDALMYLANTGRRWLLVLDDAPGPGALAELPNSGNGRVLVTSRHRGGYDAFGAELAVDVFDAQTATPYLLARTGRTNLEASAANSVATALGFLPLALAHAGAYCEAGAGVPFDEYLELLEGLPSQDLFDANPEVFYQHTVAATWNTSITAAGRHAPLARRALDMTAFLAPDAIPRSFFSVLEDNSPAGRRQVAAALAALHRYSLATVADNQVSVHRLLQKVIRDRLAGPEQADAVAQALTAVHAAMPGDPMRPTTWTQWQELVPHIATLANVEAVASVDAARLMAILNPACLFLISAGSPLQALDLATRGAAVSAKHLGHDQPDTLTARGYVAQSHNAAGHIGQAITVGREVAAGFERVLGPDHPDTLTSWDNLAHSYLAADRTGQAIVLGERVVAGRGRLLGPRHPETLAAWANLAISYWKAGQTSKAITVQERVVADADRILGPGHTLTLAAQAGLALSYRDADRDSDAIKLFEGVVAGSERVLGSEHPSTLDARMNLASSYVSAGHPADAIAQLEQVIDHLDHVLGSDHPRTLNARGNLAGAYAKAEQTSQAIALQERVVADFERVLGSDHSDTIIARANMAILYDSAGRTGDAIALLNRVIADSERVLGPDHPQTVTIRANLAEVRQRAKATPQED